MATNGKEESYKDFMSKVKARFAPWSEDKIKTILRENFVNFDPLHNNQYVACLQKAWEKEALDSRKKVAEEAERIRKEEAARFAASPEEIERRRRLAEEQYGPETCPYCGQSTRNELGWWSAVYRMPGWKCNGSLDHFLRWAREHRRQHVYQDVSNGE